MYSLCLAKTVYWYFSISRIQKRQNTNFQYYSPDVDQGGPFAISLCTKKTVSFMQCNLLYNLKLMVLLCFVLACRRVKSSKASWTMNMKVAVHRHSSLSTVTMKSAAILALLVGSATAFAPSAKSAIESESRLVLHDGLFEWCIVVGADARMCVVRRSLRRSLPVHQLIQW